MVHSFLESLFPVFLGVGLLHCAAHGGPAGPACSPGTKTGQVPRAEGFELAANEAASPAKEVPTSMASDTQASSAWDARPMWRALARARVLVRIGSVGVERVGGKRTGRLAWLESFRRLHEASAGTTEVLGRLHEVILREGTVPQALLRERTAADQPVILQLDFAPRMAAGGPAGLRPGGPPRLDGRRRQARASGPAREEYDLPTVAELRQLLAALPARPALSRHDFDNRFMLFLAEQGLGLSVPRAQARDSKGGYLFHQALAQLGERTPAASPAPRLDRTVQAAPGSLQELVDVLHAEVDPLFHPQLVLRQDERPGMGLEIPVQAMFPADAPRMLFPYLAYSVAGDRVTAPDLIEVNACCRRKLLEPPAAAPEDGATGPGQVPWHCVPGQGKP